MTSLASPASRAVCAVFTFVVAIAGGGCGKTPDKMMMQPDAGPQYPTFQAANTLPNSDPRAEGQYRFLYDAWGAEQLKTWPPADFMVSLQTSEPDVFGNQFSKWGWIPDPNDDLPVGLKRGLVDSTQVHETCSACHVGPLPDGRLWMGAPNVTLDFDGFRLAVNQRWVAAGHPTMIDTLNQMKKATLGPGREDADSGGYPTAVPAKFPPYYQLGQRTRTNYLGTGRNVRTEAYLSIFTFGAGDPSSNPKLPFPSMDHVGAFLDFFGTIDPPKAPVQDTALVAQGKQVFASARCDACHHPDDVSKDDTTPLPDSSVTEKIPGDDPAWPKGVIQTDPLHRILIAENSGPGPSGDGGSGVDTGYLALLEFIQDNNLQAGASDGYRVGYLGGLWARAPYLHNGSVATLSDLLLPAAQRPKTITVRGFTLDTTVPGSSAQGHEFGTQLSADDKTALIAYLNSL